MKYLTLRIYSMLIFSNFSINKNKIEIINTKVYILIS